MKKIFASVAMWVVATSGPLIAASTGTGYAPLNGMKIYYEVHGVSDGQTPPLVLLHGGGSTIETSFGKVMNELSKNRQVIAFEQQGHGHTNDVDRPFTFESSAEDTIALLKYLKVPKADFFGYSNGGSIALLVGIRYPAFVRKLVVASAMTKRDGLNPSFWDGMRNASLENMPAELKEAYLKCAPRATKNLQSFHDKCVKRMLDFKDWPDSDVKSIQAPTMILIADQDVIRPEHAVELFRLLPHGSLAILPNTDHMTLVNRWPVEMIERFLNDGTN